MLYTIIIIIGVLFTGFGILIYFGFRKKPVNHSQYFLKNKNKTTAMGKTVIVAGGDSLTHATLSSDYLAMLRLKPEISRFEIVNAGQNGETAEGLLKRLDRDILLCDPAIITILIGTNDAIRSKDINVTLEKYRKIMTELVQCIKSKSAARIILISIPPLGENLQSEKNREIGQFNAILKSLSSENDLDYLPYNEKLTAIIAASGTKKYDQFVFSALMIFKSAFKKIYQRLSYNEISAGNGLTVLNDGVHLNDKAGNILADLLAAHLKNLAR